MSGRSQPRARISARVMGSGAVGVSGFMEGPREAGADAGAAGSAPSEDPAAAAPTADDVAAPGRLHARAEAGLAAALGVAAADLDVHVEGPRGGRRSPASLREASQAPQLRQQDGQV